MDVIVSNASPLIGLSSVNLLSVLRELWREIIIPDAVYREVVFYGAGRKGAKVVEKACNKWIKVEEVENINEVEALQAILDNGEAEVITLGQELKADLLLLDNREPRLFAKRLNLKVIGTVGIIKLAWQKGLVKEPLEALHKLRLNSFWIDDKIILQLEQDIGKEK